jgi:hypothetical protein
MSGVIFVEELDRAGKVERRHQVRGATARIGRGYGNAVILDDNRLAAEHLEVTLDTDDTLRLRALDANHPFWLNGKPSLQAPLDQEMVIIAGDTRLRFRTPAYQVAAIQPPHRYDWRMALDRPWLSAGLFLLSLLALAGQGWLQETEVRTVLGTALPIFVVAVVMLVWAGLWSLTSRVLVKHHHFLQHLGITASVLLGSVLLLDGVVQPLSILWLARSAYFACVAMLIALWSFGHLRLCSHSNRRPLQLVGLLGLIAAGFMVLSGYNSAHHFSPSIPANVRVISLPPSWQPSESPAKFFDGMPDLAKKADAAAKAIDD